VISAYFREVARRLEETTIIVDRKIDYKEFSSEEGMIRGTLLFITGYVLEFMEYVQKDERLKYRFHLMDAEGNLIFRYDNAPHYRLSTFPHHKHLPKGVTESREQGLLDVLREIELLVLRIKS
jgi:hypothetical protein